MTGFGAYGGNVGMAQELVLTNEENENAADPVDAWLEPREKIVEDELPVLFVRIDMDGAAKGRAQMQVVGV